MRLAKDDWLFMVFVAAMGLLCARLFDASWAAAVAVAAVAPFFAIGLGVAAWNVIDAIADRRAVRRR